MIKKLLEFDDENPRDEITVPDVIYGLSSWTGMMGIGWDDFVAMGKTLITGDGVYVDVMEKSGHSTFRKTPDEPFSINPVGTCRSEKNVKRDYNILYFLITNDKN